MLEKILDGIVTAETYTVRIIDEGIHTAVDKTVKSIEKNGFDRELQAFMLSCFSGFSAQIYVFVHNGRELWGNSE